MSLLANTEVVLQIMKSLNRPCSVNCLVQKGTELTQSNVQRALDNLVRGEKVTVKEYSKQKIYAVKQDSEDDPELAKMELRTLDIDITAVEKKIKEKSAELKTFQDQQKQKPVKKSNSVIRAENSQLLNQIADVTLKIMLKNDQNQLVTVMNPDEKKNIKHKYENYSTAYKKRQKLCKDMIEMIMEGYPGTKKKLVADIGLETDESVGFVFAPPSLKSP